MGICSSCLGRNRDGDVSSEDENSRLLFDDVHANHYGSFGDQGAGTIQADPQELQRETEALDKVVAQTSNHLVDIFAMVPQSIIPATNAIYPAQDARLLRYQDVLAKMSTHDQSKALSLAAENAPNNLDGWISEEDGPGEPKSDELALKSDNAGPLLGGFADAETME